MLYKSPTVTHIIPIINCYNDFYAGYFDESKENYDGPCLPFYKYALLIYKNGVDGFASCKIKK